MMNVRRVLQVIYIFGPQHILGGISAAKRNQELPSNFRRIVVLRQNWLKADSFRRMTETCETLLSSSDVEFVSVDEKIWESLIISFPEKIGIDRDSYDEIELIYPHDVVTTSVEDLNKCLDNPKLICFGDAMGTVYSKSKVDPPRNLLHRLSMRRKTTSQDVNRIFRETRLFHLILPILNTEINTTNVVIQVPDRKSIRLNISELTKGIEGELVDFLQKETSERSAILCLDNLSEGNFLSLDKEIEMYVDFVHELGSDVEKIFVKPHPLDEHNKVDLIKARAISHDVVEIPFEFSRIPLELWPIEVFKGVVSSMSGPNLSLRYLHNFPVHNPIDRLRLDKYITGLSLSVFTLDQEQIASVKASLPNWDAKGVLYKKNAEQ